MRIVIALISAALLLAAASTQAAPERTVEQTVQQQDGTRLVRTVIRSSRTGSAGGEPAPAAAPPAGARGTLLWLDQVHLNGIAQSMAISGDGQHVVAGWWLNNARVALYDAQGSGVPSWTHPMTSSFFVPVGASNDGSLITGTGRQDLLYAWDASSATPFCAEQHPTGYEGYAALTPDAGGAFAGAAAQPGGDSRTDGHDAACTGLYSVPLAATVQGGDYAAGGGWVAVNSRTQVQVLDAASGALRGTIPISGETQTPVSISADGNIAATGGFSRTTRVYQWDGAQYQLLWSHFISGTTWITAIDVSDDGSTVMVGTVRLTTPELGHVLMYDVASGPTPLWSSAEFGDEVNSVALSADGSVGVAGSWGRMGGTFGHLVAAFRRDSATPFFTIDDDEIAGVASCFAVALSNDGTAGCAGGKRVHARDFGNGGYALAFELPGPAAVSELAVPAAVALRLGSSRPNPLARATTLPLELARDGQVRLRVVDALGRTVRVADLGSLAAGTHALRWDGADQRGRPVPNGVYFYQVESRGRTASRRLVVAR